VESGISSIKQLAYEAGIDIEGFVYSVRNRVKLFDTKAEKESYIAGQPPDTPFSLFGTMDEISEYVSLLGVCI